MDTKKIMQLFNIDKEEAKSWFVLGVTAGLTYMKEFLNTFNTDDGADIVIDSFEKLYVALNEETQKTGGDGNGQDSFLN